MACGGVETLPMFHFAPGCGFTPHPRSSLVPRTLTGNAMRSVFFNGSRLLSAGIECAMVNVEHFPRPRRITQSIGRELCSFRRLSTCDFNGLPSSKNFSGRLTFAKICQHLRCLVIFPAVKL